MTYEKEINLVSDAAIKKCFLKLDIGRYLLEQRITGTVLAATKFSEAGASEQILLKFKINLFMIIMLYGMTQITVTTALVPTNRKDVDRNEIKKTYIQRCRLW